MLPSISKEALDKALPVFECEAADYCTADVWGSFATSTDTDKVVSNTVACVLSRPNLVFIPVAWGKSASSLLSLCGVGPHNANLLGLWCLNTLILPN